MIFPPPEQLTELKIRGALCREKAVICIVRLIEKFSHCKCAYSFTTPSHRTAYVVVFDNITSKRGCLRVFFQDDGRVELLLRQNWNDTSLPVVRCISQLLNSRKDATVHLCE